MYEVNDYNVKNYIANAIERAKELFKAIFLIGFNVTDIKECERYRECYAEYMHLANMLNDLKIYNWIKFDETVKGEDVDIC